MKILATLPRLIYNNLVLETGILGETMIDTFSYIQMFQFSSHPYLFFNQDGYTMTFMGLWVDKAGNLIDFRTKEIIAKNFLDKRLRRKLQKNLISFDEDYFSWKK